ncbi:sel1 repeat family protein [Aggregatibacter actinomycetemcomitans]|nr:sel1 repeat family protein [Aggregatibacter actinomycetemcomitans]
MLSNVAFIAATVALSLNTGLNVVETPQNPTALLESQQNQITTEQAKALFEEGFDYRYGVTKPIDDTKANRLLKQAADLGNADAAFFYALASVEGDISSADKYARIALSEGNGAGDYVLAEILEQQEGSAPEDVEKLFQAGFKAFKVKVEQGDLHYANLLGYAYRYGIGTEENTALAIQAFKKAVEQGNSVAMGNLGEIYIEQDKREQARPLMLKSAERNNPASQYDFAFYFLESGSKEYFYWMEKAADNDYIEALNALGAIYGDSNDDKKAIEYFQRAVDLGDDFAAYALSTIYREGYGVPADEKKYREYLALAGERGNEDALGSLIHWAIDEKDDNNLIYWLHKVREIDEDLFKDFTEYLKNHPRYQEIMGFQKTK